MVTLDIVIVNWNGGEGLARCVESVARAVAEPVELQRLVVVDNASSDGSVSRLPDAGGRLRLIRNAENRGFAAACNQGARDSQAEYLLFLNPDTEINARSLSVPLRFLEQPENQDVGVVGIQLVGEDGHVSRSCARFPTPALIGTKMVGLDRILPRRFPGFIMEDWAHDRTAEVDHVIGAFYLVRRALFEEIGGFDEQFFVYLEDLDFSFRARRAGWRSVYLAEAQAYHKGGGTSEQVRAMRLFFSLRSRILYGFKHFPRSRAAALTAGTLLLEPVVRLLWSGARGGGREVLETLQGYGMLWRSAPRTLAAARRQRIGG